MAGDVFCTAQDLTSEMAELPFRRSGTPGRRGAHVRRLRVNDSGCGERAQPAELGHAPWHARRAVPIAMQSNCKCMVLVAGILAATVPVGLAQMSDSWTSDSWSGQLTPTVLPSDGVAVCPSDMRFSPPIAGIDDNPDHSGCVCPAGSYNYRTGFIFCFDQSKLYSDHISTSDDLAFRVT